MSKTQKPQIYKKMGLIIQPWQSPFTGGLDGNNSIFSIRIDISMSNYFDCLKGRNLNDLEKGRVTHAKNRDKYPGFLFSNRL